MLEHTRQPLPSFRHFSGNLSLFHSLPGVSIGLIELEVVATLVTSV